MSLITSTAAIYASHLTSTPHEGRHHPCLLIQKNRGAAGNRFTQRGTRLREGGSPQGRPRPSTKLIQVWTSQFIKVREIFRFYGIPLGKQIKWKGWPPNSLWKVSSVPRKDAQFVSEGPAAWALQSFGDEPRNSLSSTDEINSTACSCMCYCFSNVCAYIGIIKKQIHF